MVYDGRQIYGDVSSPGQFQLRYLQGPDGEMLARLDAGGPHFYLTVLSAKTSILRRQTQQFFNDDFDFLGFCSSPQ